MNFLHEPLKTSNFDLSDYRHHYYFSRQTSAGTSEVDSCRDSNTMNDHCVVLNRKAVVVSVREKRRVFLRTIAAASSERATRGRSDGVEIEGEDTRHCVKRIREVKIVVENENVEIFHVREGEFDSGDMIRQD